MLEANQNSLSEKRKKSEKLYLVQTTVTSFCTGRVANSQYNNVVNKMTLITYEYVYLK